MSKIFSTLFMKHGWVQSQAEHEVGVIVTPFFGILCSFILHSFDKYFLS